MAALLAATAALAGCVGKDQVRTRFYLLSPLPETTAALPSARGVQHADPLSLDIAALRLPQYLHRPQIVTRSADNRVTLAEYDQWGGNLGKNMMRVLAQNLSRLLATPEIAIFSRRPARAADLRIEIEVLQFERDPDARVHLAVQWRVRGADHEVPTRITELHSPPLGAGADDAPDMDATVAAMSALWGAFSRIVAEAILDTRPGTGPAAAS